MILDNWSKLARPGAASIAAMRRWLTPIFRPNASCDKPREVRIARRMAWSWAGVETGKFISAKLAPRSAECKLVLKDSIFTSEHKRATAEVAHSSVHKASD